MTYSADRRVRSTPDFWLDRAKSDWNLNPIDQESIFHLRSYKGDGHRPREEVHGDATTYQPSCRYQRNETTPPNGNGLSSAVNQHTEQAGAMKLPHLSRRCPASARNRSRSRSRNRELAKRWHARPHRPTTRISLIQIALARNTRQMILPKSSNEAASPVTAISKSTTTQIPLRIQSLGLPYSP